MAGGVLDIVMVERKKNRSGKGKRVSKVLDMLEEKRFSIKDSRVIPHLATVMV